MDPRWDFHAVGPLHARLRSRGQRLLLFHRRRRGGAAGPADHVRDRRRARAHRGDARPSRRLRGLDAGADRQRRLRAEAARRLGGGARLGLPAHEVARLHARGRMADSQARRRVGDRQLEEARPRHLGGARRAAALHLLQADVLGGVRSGCTPRRAARRPRPG